MSDTIRENAPGGDTEPFNARQAEVLEAALALLVEGGDKALTTARLAGKANCSKESLYRWFGDRNGLLAAMIEYQASKVRVTAPSLARANQADFCKELARFARDLLTVLSGSTSLALNRLAIGEAGREGAQLGTLLIERGRRMIEKRAGGLIEAGRKAGHLRFDDRDEAFHTLYGLIVGDLHVQMLLGDAVPQMTDAGAIERQAARAVDQFFRLFGTGSNSTANDNT